MTHTVPTTTQPARIHRLATYGTLAPGRPNHHHLADLTGKWSTGHVHGNLVHAGWGADFGYPALNIDQDGPVVDVHLFESFDLPHHWDRLDTFEGAGYQRSPVTVHADNGDKDAFIYTLRPPA